jgi:hypothetical protein
MGNTNSRRQRNKSLRAGTTNKDKQLNTLANNASLRNKNKQSTISPNNVKKPVERVIPRPKQAQKSGRSKINQRLKESKKNAESRVNRPRVESAKCVDKVCTCTLRRHGASCILTTF